MNTRNAFEKIMDAFWSEPLMTLVISAALIAFATTPIAFAVLGRTKWFEARRGRVMLRPAFASVVCSMILVMGVPAIFLAMVVKSHNYDKDRYEFDPNKTWSVIEQGRGFNNVQELDRAVKLEYERMGVMKANLVNSVKKLDDAMLALRAVAGTSPAVAQTLPAVLQRLATVRQSIGFDGPQQLMDFTAPPAEIANVMVLGNTVGVNVPPPQAAAPIAPLSGLTKAQAEAELATVPTPQKTIASMLPLADPPVGWVVGKSGSLHLETFNAENLFEKIDGRAESFTQAKVKGMAYAYYHPAGDESNEVQLYIFEMAGPVYALSKYGTEKPDEGIKLMKIGNEGYTSAGSLLFYSDRFYTQIVSTKDDPKFAEFSEALARRVVAMQGSPDSATPNEGTPGAKPKVTSQTIFDFLPKEPGRDTPKFVVQDVFGYEFLTDVFMADYREGNQTLWQGFIRPYHSNEEALAVLAKYVTGAKADGAELKEVTTEAGDKMVISSNVGLIDVIFAKGNGIGGVSGASDAAKAEAFVRGFAKSLPGVIPVITDSLESPPGE